MIKASAGITDDDPANDAFEKLRLCCESEAVADLLAVALGVLGAAEGERTSAELTWAALRWAEQLADLQPLVLVFEDVHWAEEPLLDLIEHLARSLRNVPVLIVAVTRPDLLDTRPSWGGGIRRASAIELARSTRPRARSSRTPCSRGPTSRRRSGRSCSSERRAIRCSSRRSPACSGDDERARPHPRQRAGADRRPDRPARAQARSASSRAPRSSAGCSGAARSTGWCPTSTSTAPRRAARPRVRRPRGALDHLRRPRVPLQARAHPRRRLRRDEQGAARGAASGRSRTGSTNARATSSQRSGRYHLDHAAQLLVELGGAVSARTGARRRRGSSSRPAAARLQRGAFVAARRTLLRAVELEPSPERRYLAAHAAWRLSDVPSVREEAEVALAEARAAGLPDHRGPLARAARRPGSARREQRRSRPRPRRRGVGDPAGGRAVGLYDANALIATIFWWRGDADGATRHGRGDARPRTSRPAGRSSRAWRSRSSRASPACRATAQSLELLERAEALAESSGSREAMAFALAVRGRRFGEAESDEAENTCARRWRCSARPAPRTLRLDASNLGAVYGSAATSPLAEKSFRDAVAASGTHEQGYLVEAERRLAEVLSGRARSTRPIARRRGAAPGRSRRRLDACVDAARRRARPGGAGPHGRGGGRLPAALEIIEPTMYAILTRDIRASLESLRAELRPGPPPEHPPPPRRRVL